MIQIALLIASGWFLLTPPIQEEMKDGKYRTGNWSISEEAPYSKWEHQSSHDTAKDCELEKERFAKDAIERLTLVKENWNELDEKYRRMFTTKKMTTEEYVIANALNPRHLTALHLASMKARCIPADLLFAPVKK